MHCSSVNSSRTFRSAGPRTPSQKRWLYHARGRPSTAGRRNAIIDDLDCEGGGGQGDSAMGSCVIASEMNA